jgi:hypothetical protein
VAVCNGVNALLFAVEAKAPEAALLALLLIVAHRRTTFVKNAIAAIDQEIEGSPDAFNKILEETLEQMLDEKLERITQEKRDELEQPAKDTHKSEDT